MTNKRLFCSTSMLFLSLAAFLAVFASHGFGAETSDRTGSAMKAYPQLASRGAFTQEFDMSKSEPGMSRRGALGVGNGRVFALMGLGIPQNKLTNLVGPKYEKPEELVFTHVWFGVSRRGADGVAAPVKMTKSTLYRPAGTGVVVCEENGGGLKLTTVTYAPPGRTFILRAVTVGADKDAPPSGDEILLTVDAHRGDEKAEPFGPDMLTHWKGGRMMTIGSITPAEVRTEPGRLTTSLGTLAPGMETSMLFYITFNMEGETVSPPMVAAVGPALFLDETLEDWRKWYDGALTVDSDTPRLAGLFENALAIIKTQQDANSGSIAPMARYSRAWCRDGFGPERLLLASGKTADVRRFIEYLDYATRIQGFRNSYDLDLDVKTAPKEVDWGSMRTQQGDDPNLIILQYHHYWLATGDKDFIREHYGFIRANFTGQNTEGYRLPFNGDETYQVYVMMADGAAMKDFYTPDTGFAYSAAGEALAEMADAIGETADAAEFRRLAAECRAKTEEYYFDETAGYYIPYVKKAGLKPTDSPFANINLDPLWLGYAPPDEKQRRNVLASMKKLIKKNGVLKSHVRSGNYTGMTPGMLLYSLAALGETELADAAYTAMMNEVISPTGEFAEAYDSRDKWLNYSSEPTVYRPWETSINVEAALFYMTGMRREAEGAVRFSPHLPPDANVVRIGNLHAGPHKFTMRIERKENANLDVEIINEGNAPVMIVLETPPAAGVEPPDAVESAVNPASGAKIWKQSRLLKPGEQLRAICGGGLQTPINN